MQAKTANISFKEKEDISVKVIVLERASVLLKLHFFSSLANVHNHLRGIATMLGETTLVKIVCLLSEKGSSLKGKWSKFIHFS